jgi:acid phosphatase family membrane protein YuiD
LITPYLYVPVIAWALAQLIKVVIEIIKGDADVKYLYASGGMPSAHSAVVVSLAGYTFYHQGANSPLFGVTAIISGIVMYDSFGVRRSSGEQAKALNKLIAEMAHNGNLRKPDDYARLREVLGHQPLEVIVGALLGGLVATLFSLDQLSPIIDWVTSLPTKPEIYLILVIGVLMVLAPILYFVLARKKLKKDKKIYELSKYILGVNIIIGLAMIFAGAISYESIAPYGQRWLSVFGVAVWLIFMLIATWRWAGLKKAVKFDTNVVSERKQDWLKKAGKKK